MFRNYLKAAWRSVVKQKAHTAINIAGLTLGLAACFVIAIVVKNELSYDSWHSKADRTYRVTLNEIDFNPSVSTAILPKLVADFPEIETGTSVIYMRGSMIRVGENKYSESHVLAADDRFPEVFDYTWLQGDKRTALSEPNTVVLTESIARKYFGDADPIGKPLNLDNRVDLKVSAVVKDPPGNTHLPFSMIISWPTFSKDFKNDEMFDIRGSMSYVVLPPGYDVSRFPPRIKPFIARHWGKEIADRTNLPFQPLQSIHFDQRYLFNSESPTVSRSAYVALGGVALFILITACINFINLATVQSLKRSREVGVRKTLGSSRAQLIRQFLLETGIITFAAVLLALGLTLSLLPQVATYMGATVTAGALLQPHAILTVLGLGLLVVLLAGLYPAFVQSSFRPVLSLKGAVKTGGLSLRRSLVVTQFVISQALIAGTLIVAHQMDYFRNGDMGYDKEAVISMPMAEGGGIDKLQALLAGMPGVKDYSFSVGAPAYSGPATSFQTPEMKELMVADLKAVDERYFDMFKLQMLAGEKIGLGNDKDTVRDMVINETMLHNLGYKTPEAVLGRVVPVGFVKGRITGVVADFQLGSKHKAHRSVALFYLRGLFFNVSVKLDGKDTRKTIASLEKAWLSVFPAYVFEYQFLDDHIAALYKQEQKVYTAFRVFSLIAILIGCLGLYGLVAFSAAQRTKEIGIRKVLGASVTSILGLFGKEFIWLILIAFCIATPLAFFLMKKWLGNFAYQVNIGSDVFMVTIAATFVIAGITIIHRALKAAWMNPVKSLKAD